MNHALLHTLFLLAGNPTQGAQDSEYRDYALPQAAPPIMYTLDDSTDLSEDDDSFDKDEGEKKWHRAALLSHQSFFVL